MSKSITVDPEIAAEICRVGRELYGQRVNLGPNLAQYNTFRAPNALPAEDILHAVYQSTSRNAKRWAAILEASGLEVPDRKDSYRITMANRTSREDDVIAETAGFRMADLNHCHNDDGPLFIRRWRDIRRWNPLRHAYDVIGQQVTYEFR